MTGTGSHTGEGLGAAIKKGVGMVHGTGEAIRGNVNAAVDSATGDHESAQRQQNIAARGVDEFEHGHYHGTGAGVTPKDTDRERVNRYAQGESNALGSTNYGPHGTNVGNKLDPRFDSDLDNRGTTTGSTNVGPHSTNIGNRADPRVEDEYPTAQYDGTSGQEESNRNRAGNALTDVYSGSVSNRTDRAVPPTERQNDHRNASDLLLQYPLYSLPAGMIAADAIFRNSNDYLDAQDTTRQTYIAESMHTPCSSTELETVRLDTFPTPKRADTDSQLIRSNTISPPPRCDTDPPITQSNTFSPPPRCGTDPAVNLLNNSSPLPNISTDPAVVRVPKRANTEFHVILNGLFGFSPSQSGKESKETSLRLSNARTHRQSTYGSKVGSKSLEDAPASKIPEPHPARNVWKRKKRTLGPMLVDPKTPRLLRNNRAREV